MDRKAGVRILCQLLEREQQTVVALLHQIQKIHALRETAFGDRNNYGKVRFNQPPARGFRPFVMGQYMLREFYLFILRQRGNGTNLA